jgi:hypothetical protein
MAEGSERAAWKAMRLEWELAGLFALKFDYVPNANCWNLCVKRKRNIWSDFCLLF